MPEVESTLKFYDKNTRCSLKLSPFSPTERCRRVIDVPAVKTFKEENNKSSGIGYEANPGAKVTKPLNCLKHFKGMYFSLIIFPKKKKSKWIGNREDKELL